jgi:hypothetical protein
VTKVLLLLACLPIAGLIALGFARWERRGKEHYAVLLLLGILVLESTLYENQDLMPRSIFHPGTGSLQFRLPEVVITLALIGRLIARGKPVRIGIPAMLWAAFGMWMTVALLEGVLRHNDITQLQYEGKAIIYVVGGYALAAGVPVHRYLESGSFVRFMRWSAIPAAVLIVLSNVHASYVVNIPLLPLPDFGIVGTDTATIYASIGVLVFLLDLASGGRNWRSIVFVLPLLACTVPSGQRAALIDLGVTAAVILLAVSVSSGRRRFRVTGGNVVCAVLAIVAVVVLVLVVPAAVSKSPVQVPVVSTISHTFNSTGKAESAQERVNEWKAAKAIIPQDLLIGHGLGFEYTYYSPASKQFLRTDITHNIILDLLMRTGLIGLILFLSALGVSLYGGVQVWRRHPDRFVAVLALGLVAVILGLVSKGMVESIFEKYRLASLLGLMLGMLRSAVVSMGRSATPDLVDLEIYE